MSLCSRRRSCLHPCLHQGDTPSFLLSPQAEELVPACLLGFLNGGLCAHRVERMTRPGKISIDTR